MTKRLRRLTPPFPHVATDGTSDAIEFARASIARRLIADRRNAGLSQQQLAKLAGVRRETISRIESGKQTATVRVIDKLDKAIRRAAGPARKRRAG
jgi:DNA-binding XRE family transcriptional regulator